MDTIIEGPNEEETQIQDLNVIDTSNWAGNANTQSIANNNSTLLYIAVEYVKRYKEGDNPNLTSQQDTFADFTPHVSPLDPNMSSVARYSPVPVQYQEPTSDYNPVVIHQLVSQDSNEQNEQFVANLNTDSTLESIPAVLCNDIREVNSQYLQMVNENNINMVVGHNDELQLSNENKQEVELLITDQATGISYSVNAQELLVENSLEDEQQLLDALTPDRLLESDLLALDDNTLKSELNNELIHNPTVATSVTAEVVNSYINSFSNNDIKSLDESCYRMETRRRAADLDVEEQLLSCVYSITDKPILSRARASLPEPYLVINKINEENIVFAKKIIPKQTQFGPLEGVLIPVAGSMDNINNEQDLYLKYFVELDRNVFQIDVSNEEHANWMSFVRKATTFEEQNLVVSIENESIYFTSTKIISPKQELKVGYSCLYAQRFNLKVLQPTEMKPWPCYECPLTFSTSEEFQKHLNIHDEERDENIKPKKLSKKKHRFAKNVEAVECTECKEVFYSNLSYSMLKSHMSQKHHYKGVNVDSYFTTVSTFKCDHCESSFRSEALKKIHNLEHEPDLSEEQTNHICPQCQRKFPTQRQLILHVINHALPKNICLTEKMKCPVCHKTFSQRDRLRKHMLLFNHGPEESKPLPCKSCNKRFLNNSALASHLKTHFTGKKVFECPICKESFDHVLKLKMHVPKHCQNSQFTCPHCKKVFQKYSIIRKHIRAFHCELKHQCQQCSKLFPTLDKLRMHLLKHSDHREFLCADCGKQFKRKDKLKEHCKRIHSGERENVAIKPKPAFPSAKKFTPKVEPTDFHRFIYKCHSCLVGFKRRGMLVNHLAKRHPDIPPDSVPELNLPILLTTRDYYCQYCDKVYKSSSKRKAHILKNHPGAALPISNRKQTSVQEIPDLPNPTFSQTVGSITARPQSCTWCHKQYASKAKLLQHQRKKHPEKMPSIQKDEDVPDTVENKEHEQILELLPTKQELIDFKIEPFRETYSSTEPTKINLNDIIGNGIEAYGVDEDSQYCHLSINENDIMDTNELENPNSRLYRLLTSANNGPSHYSLNYGASESTSTQKQIMIEIDKDVYEEFQSGLLSVTECDIETDFELDKNQDECKLDNIMEPDNQLDDGENAAQKVNETNSEQDKNYLDNDENYNQEQSLVMDIEETVYNPPVAQSDNDDDSDPEYLLPLARLVKPKLKRNNKAKPIDWKVKTNRKLRMKGQEYLGYRRPKNSSKVFHDAMRKPRKIKEVCNTESCKKSSKRFCSKLKEEERMAQFEKFWKDMDWGQRKVYVSSLVDCETSVRKRTLADKSRRSVNFRYHLKIGGIRRQVCKKTFLNTFSLGEWAVRSWVIDKKDDAGIHVSRENRNEERSETLRKPKKREQKENLNKFLEIIPKLPSHYCRKQTDKLYLEPLFTTMTQFYNVYLQHCKEKQMLHLSRQVFDKTVSEMKLSIFHPKKDACDTCVKHDVGNIAAEDYQLHIERKEQARQEKDEDKKKAIEGKCFVICADLQAVKLSPFFNASALYFKTKLCIHNYTLFDLASHDVRCYWWNESEGELVASVFASCLIDFLNKYKSYGKPIIVWTDGCTYQNRNSILSSALLQFSINNNVIIEQKYLERGHTQMECVSVHAVIENKLKNRVIHLPSDYIAVAKEARQNPRPYEVKYLSFDFFSDYTRDQLCSSIRPGSVTVTELRCIKYLPDGKIMFKCNFSDEYKELPQRIKSFKRNPKYEPPKLYKNRIKITSTKWKHLQQLKAVLPKDCHHFYDNLPHH